MRLFVALEKHMLETGQGPVLPPHLVSLLRTESTRYKSAAVTTEFFSRRAFGNICCTCSREGTCRVCIYKKDLYSHLAWSPQLFSQKVRENLYKECKLPIPMFADEEDLGFQPTSKGFSIIDPNLWLEYNTVSMWTTKMCLTIADKCGEMVSPPYEPF